MKENVYQSCTIEGNKNGAKKIKKKWSLKNVIVKHVPILEWLPNYSWKSHLHGDLIAGLTVGIMHVPQGMAYASLAGVPPVYGMYSSFFASLIYMFFGTARHISIGVFAVASMMVGAARLRLAPDAGADFYPLGGYVEPLIFTSALTFLTGTIQILMGILRLGFLTTYLSDPLISGFTTGAAFHVFTSQLNKVFGVKLARHEGIGMIVKMLRDLFLSLNATNFMALAISLGGIVFLDVGKTFLNPLVKKVSPIPPPLELILVIFGVVISSIFGLKDNFGVSVVNEIPRGFPLPSLPHLNFLPQLLPDAIPIAIVCYMFVMSMGKLFAKKHKYKTDATQELYACGLAGIGSSFFPVYPVGASLSRSSVCEMSGANTQFYTVFSSFLLLTVILFLGPLLEPLPMCILSAIVIVSLKSLFLQVKELPRLWRVCRYDFTIWLVACLSTILTDVTTGLIISLVFSLFTLVLRQQWPTFTSSTEIHLDETPRQHIPENVEILKFSASLNFANVTIFTDKMSDAIARSFPEMHAESEAENILEKRILIVDCSAISYVDSMGIDAIKDTYVDARKSQVSVLFSGLPEEVLSILRLDEIFNEKVPQDIFFPTIDRCVLANTVKNMDLDFYRKNNYTKCPPRFLESFENPTYIRTVYFTTAFLSIILSLYTFYLIQTVKEKRMKSVKNVLFQLQAWAFVTNIISNILVTPYMFIPSMAVGSLGLLEYLGVNFKVQAYVGQTCYDYLAVAVLTVFEDRHNSISTISYRFKLQSKKSKFLFYFLNYFYASIVFLPYVFEKDDTDNRKMEILKNIIPCPNEIFFSSVTHIMSAAIERTAVLTFSAGFVIALQGSFFTFHSIYHLIFAIDTKLSAATRKLQKMFLLSMFLQVMIPFIVVALPLLGCGFAILINFNSQFLSCHSFLAIGMYSMHNRSTEIPFLK
ncbi:unnamed protein product [Caenorhabditis angaria]|uniref:STAS domain-containing protein n=1 Tax=Caenorhabditis angaria TaxID=860376 RepID=A0A9P1IWE1_9PELO|nr:unnamed protein product [Caenorhabditis angaria]